MPAPVIIKGKNARKPYTVRYWADGRQREKSFERKTGPDGAEAFRAKADHDIRANIFVDPKIAQRKLKDVAAEWLPRKQIADKTRQNYEMALRLHILPVFGDRGLAEVASDREGVERFLRVTLPESGLGPSMVRTCFLVLNGIVNDAMRAGKLQQSRLRGIKLPALGERAEIVFITRMRVEYMGDKMPHPYQWTIYLMRGCGLRMGEALGVRKEDIRGTTLRVSRQLNDKGEYAPLKHRGEDDYRDVPIPQYVLDAMPKDFESFPAVGHRTYREWFNRARNGANLPTTFTPHTLRHIFASIALAGGVPITDVSKWLGHRSIQVTFGIYGHLVPESWDRARVVLDREWES
jgi:integrase